MVMFAQPPTPQTRPIAPWRLVGLVVGVCALVTLILGFMPTNLWRMGELVALAP